MRSAALAASRSPARTLVGWLPVMSITFLVVPQWQGSGSPRRLQISAGAAAIRARLPAAQVADVEVPGKPGEPGAGVRGYRVLREIWRRSGRSSAR